MKQQATTVINDNRVNDAHTTQLDAHTTQLDASRKKSNSTVAYTFKICCLKISV